MTGSLHYFGFYGANSWHHSPIWFLSQLTHNCSKTGLENVTWSWSRNGVFYSYPWIECTQPQADYQTIAFLPSQKQAWPGEIISWGRHAESEHTPFTYKKKRKKEFGRNMCNDPFPNSSLSKTSGQSWWLSGLAPALGPGRDPGVPRIESHVGLPAWSLLLPLPVSLPLSLCVSFMNK